MARITLRSGKCDECKRCLEHCPQEPSGLEIFNCRQCNAEEAACAAACSYDAVREVKGVPAIVREKCTDCGECIAACPYNALHRNAAGLVVKCDLCADAEKPPCARACPQAVKRETDWLGWRVEPAKTFAPDAGNATAVAGGRYLVPDDFELSDGEERLLKTLLENFKEEAKEQDVLKGREEVGAALKKLLVSICEGNNILLGTDRAGKLVQIAEMETAGYGVLDLLLADDDLEEISVVGINRPIFVFHRAKGWLSTNCMFTDESFAINTVNKMARSLGRRVTYQNPRLNATLEDGSRLHASISPITLNKVEITIRKFKQAPFSIPDLVALDTLTSEAAAFLWLSLYADVSLLIAGNTGSGKTSTLNALFAFIPLEDRIVITEETPEISLLHKHKIRIVSNEELSIPMKDLVKDTLRMRPDRVIIGEVRSRDEVEALFDSLLAGQARGSYATFHAQSGAEARTRLKALGAQEQDLAAIDLVLVQRRIPVYDRKTRTQREIRRVTEISEATATGLNPLFSYNALKDRLERTGNESQLLEKICVNYRSTRPALKRELKEREKFLEAFMKACNDSSKRKDWFPGKYGFHLFGKAVAAYLAGERNPRKIAEAAKPKAVAKAAKSKSGLARPIKARVKQSKAAKRAAAKASKAAKRGLKTEKRGGGREEPRPAHHPIHARREILRKFGLSELT